MSRVKAVSWWSDEQPEIEEILLDLKEGRDISKEILNHQDEFQERSWYAVLILAREGDNAHDFNFGQISSEGMFDCQFSLTRIKTVHGKKYPLNCMTDKQVVRKLKEVVDELGEEDKLVKVSANIFNKIVAIRPR